MLMVTAVVTATVVFSNFKKYLHVESYRVFWQINLFSQFCQFSPSQHFLYFFASRWVHQGRRLKMNFYSKVTTHLGSVTSPNRQPACHCLLRISVLFVMQLGSGRKTISGATLFISIIKTLFSIVFILFFFLSLVEDKVQKARETVQLVTLLCS